MTKIVAIGMLSLLALALACGSTTASGECTVDADCGGGQGCAFATADGCGAKGKCVSKAAAVCEAFSPGCACDGTQINTICTGFEAGLVSKPLRSAGACGSSDGGSKKPCASDSNCTPGEACAFAIAEGCAAQGKCVARPMMATCAAYSAGCACDGSEITTICTGLEEGLVSKPLRNKGTCGSSDAGADGATD